MERYTTLILSQYTTDALMSGQCITSIRFRSQQASATAFAIPLYSASALDRETVYCLFDDHETRFGPR